MTDQELIQLLQEKSAGELSPAEIEAIRARWTQSPELRQALVEHLQLESQLTGALAPVQIDVDTILKRAAAHGRRRNVFRPYWSWIAGFCLLLAIGVGLFVPFQRSRQLAQITQDKPGASPQDIDPPGKLKNEVRETEPSADLPVVMSDLEKPGEPAKIVATEATDPREKDGSVFIADNEPWSKTLSRDVAPWVANSPKLTADYKSAGHDDFPESEGKRWIAPVEGHPFAWSTDVVRNPVRRIARFHGLGKLRAPWPDKTLLRMTPFEVTDLTIYLWHGPTGVALRFYTHREPHLWAAFEITRENSSPKPTHWTLLTTDNGSYVRSTPGTFDIQRQNNELILARGGVNLMSVPFIGPPIEVFIEGQFRLRGLSMHRSVPLPDRPENAHRRVLSGPAATLPWAMSVESPASLDSNDDGSITMTVDSRTKMGIASLPFGWILATRKSPQATGLFEVIVNVESAEPGTGIFLGDRNGRPVQKIGFFRDSATQQITFGMLRPGDTRTDSHFQLNEYPPPYLAKAGWLRMVAGLGTFQIQTSGDGRHWGHVIENPGRDWPGAVGSMGLFGLSGPNSRSIRIRRVEIRELNGITDVADVRLRALVGPFSKEDFRDLAAWNHRVFDTQPGDTSASTWMTACAVQALSQGPPKELGHQLLQQLVSVGIKSNLSFEQKRQLVDDACSLCDLFDEGAAKTMGIWYEELGWQLARSGDPEPLARLRPAWLWSPIWTSSKMRYVWERLQSHEILDALYRRDWPSTWIRAKSSSYWNMPPNPDQRPTERGEELERHSRWAKSLVAEYAPGLDDGTAGIMPAGMRHPLVPVLNKEAYNLRAELQSALSGASYDDACRICLSIGLSDGPGLLPDVEDRELFVSMATSISSARKAHPGFAETMKAKFEQLGLIRVRSAINRRDVSSLQAATLQFMGTDAARDAQVWLGDTALSLGQFESGEQYFRDALVDASPDRRQLLEPRLLLARALGGQLTASQLLSSPKLIPDHPVELNGTSLSSAEFKSIIDDLVSRSAAIDSLNETSRPTVVPFPQSAVKLELRSEFDGHPGNNPGRWEYRFGDPFGKQLSVACDDRQIYVSNRFQVNAYTNLTGQQVWAQGLGSEQGEAYAMPFTPMQPLIAGDRLFVRRLTKAGTELACLNSSDGQVKWHQRPFHGVLTDPVIWNGRLFAVIMIKSDDDQVQVEAAWFDPSSGDVVSTRPLFRIREAADRQLAAQLTVSDRIAVCTVAGVTASFDALGEMRWLKRHIVMLKPVDELADDFRVSAPIVRAGRVIVSIPGVREVSCLDLDTGRSVWERPVSDLRGLIGVANDRVLADTESGLVAFDADSGQFAWNYLTDSRLEATTIDGSRLLVTRRAKVANNKSKPSLVWLDLKTGEELGQTLVNIHEREEVQLGPMFSNAGKWWTFVGETWKNPKRELHELIPVPSATPKPFVDATLLAWRPALVDSQLGEIAAVVPGWFPAANYRERLKVQYGEMHGEVNPLLSRLDGKHEVRFTTHVNLPAGGKPTLTMRVGNQPKQKWKLVVRHANTTLLEQAIEEAGSQNGWHDVSVDLSSLAGQEFSLQLIQSAMNNAAVDALWKRAEIHIE